MKPFISIGILTYNNPISELERCLESIFSQTYGIDSIEVIIRNQGNKKLVEQIKSLVEGKGWEIKVYHGENIGFGAGHNQIFSEISNQSTAYLCMNPDGFLHDEGLEKLVSFSQKNDWHGIVEAIQEPIMHPKTFNPKTGLTDWCSGACVLIPNAIYRQINGFDDDFFLYCEDVDLSWRVKAAGYQCYTCADAFFFHYAMDRQSRESEIWRAATFLAYKWRSEKFQETAMQMWLQHVDMKKNDLLEQLEPLSQHSVTEVLKANPNFNNGLHFAQPMWG